MNFERSDEQIFLVQAARGALSRHRTVEAARAALEDPAALPDLWPTAVEAGWPGLLINEESGGAGLGAFDAMLVAEECGRVLAGVPLLGLLPATAILDAAKHETLPAIAAGELRPAIVAARPPSADPGDENWTVDPQRGHKRPPAPVISGDRITGEVAFVPDVPGADLLVAIGVTDAGEPRAIAIDAGADGVRVTPVTRYDATRSLGHVDFDGATGRILEEIGGPKLAEAWYLAHALIGAESLGAVQTCLEVSVAYAKERHTFGRPIGSYQAIKHELTEVLRNLDNARGLEYYAGWAYASKPEEFPLAASAARAAAGRALDHAARTMINVHGGIGATWEHDAPLYFRRAQLSRRLLGGTADAVDRVARESLRNATAATEAAAAATAVA
jgi:alkylation response protein AidB-like acyl-CoA dehydrogenase